MSRTQNKQAGFTILELLIATVVFSVILLIVTYGIIQIGNRYYKATLQTQTQTAARNIIDEVARNLQFTAGDLSSPASANGMSAYCINDIQYLFVPNAMQTPSSDSSTLNHAFVARADTNNCKIPDNQDSLKVTKLSDGSRDLLTNRMRVVAFSITPISTNMYRINVSIAAGEDDLLNPDATCKSQAGSTYCATAALSTVVTRRIAK